MSLSAPRIIFGVHSLSPYNRSSRMPYGILKVIGSSSIALSATTDELYGGAQRFSWAAETKTFKSELSAKVKALPGFLFTAFLGGTAVDTGPSATGSATAATNYLGSSVVAATGILAALTLTGGANGDIKFGSFVIQAVDATHVNVYLMSDVDIARGNAAAYVNDSLLLNAAPLMITTGGAVPIPDTGLTLTGGGGAIAFVAGDTAVFSSLPINSSSSLIGVGQASTAMQAFGAFILAQKRATAEMFEIQAWNCVPSGFPLPLAEFAFSEFDLKAFCIYDSTPDKVFTMRAVAPVTYT